MEFAEIDTKIDTLPLLHELDSSPSQMLSRGELRRRGISNEMIDAAADAGQVILGSVDNTREGALSSMVSIILTDLGEELLDEES